MIINTLTRKQFVPAPAERVFGFFSQPENLAALTPPDLGFVIHTPSPVAMREGALIDYTIRLLGMPVRWTTIITAYEPGRSFVDEQLRGPYSYWRHTHLFEDVPGGTLVSDSVRYALPFGRLGALVHRFAVKDRLREIFDYRESVIRTLFGPGGDGAGATTGEAAGTPGGLRA